MLPDEHSAEADAARRRWEQGEVDIVVPSLFWTEVANGLQKALRQKRLTEEHADRAAVWLARTAFLPSTVPDAALFHEAMQLASRYGAAVSDCMYLALARRLEAELWHSDGRLDRALGTRDEYVLYIP